jgi:hypothetical protein
MQCMVCGAEMILMKVVPDDTMPVPGFERRTLMCSACHDVEWHLAFVRPGRQNDAEPMPVNSAPSIADGQRRNESTPPMDTAPVMEPGSTVQDERIAAPSLLKRVVAKVRGH